MILIKIVHYVSSRRFSIGCVFIQILNFLSVFFFFLEINDGEVSGLGVRHSEIKYL